MPIAAYCMACAGWVWVSPDGGCSSGHSRGCLRSLHESPAVSGVPVPPSPPAPSGVLSAPVNDEFRVG